jgi:GNAT superfamily N-acetyltransferase
MPVPPAALGSRRGGGRARRAGGRRHGPRNAQGSAPRSPPKCGAGSRVKPQGLTVRHPVPMDHLRLVDAWSGWSDQPLRREASRLLQRLCVTHFANTSLVAESRDGSSGGLPHWLPLPEPSRRDAYVHFVGVRPDYRRRGLATFLYERFFDCCRKHDTRLVRGVRSPVNKGSIDFHRRLGFALEAGGYESGGIPIHRDYDGPGIDMLLLRKDLTGDVEPTVRSMTWKGIARRTGR